MPMFIIIYLIAFITSINGLLQEEQISGRERYGVINFKYPIYEVLFAQFNLYCLFLWVKYCENVTEKLSDLSE